MPWKNERLECYGVLRTVIASFEVHSYLLSQLPVPKDSNDYREGLIYLFCNNYLTFHVFKQVLTKPWPSYYDSRVKDVEHVDWFVWLNMRKFVFCAFLATEFLCRS